MVKLGYIPSILETEFDLTRLVDARPDVTTCSRPKFLSFSERAALMFCVRCHREDHRIAQVAKFFYLEAGS
jgi:hypothetical protein